MKTSNENKKGENKKGWLRSLTFTIAFMAVSQVFIACGGGGGGGAPAPVPLPIGVGLGTFSAANCGGTGGVTNFIACAIGKYPGFEVLVQISAAQTFTGGLAYYEGPVLVNGVINVLPGYGCAAATSYSFTSTAGQMNYSSPYGNLLRGTVTATGTSQLTILFGNTFLMADGMSVLSSTGQSFAYHLMNQIRITSAGVYGTGTCVIPSGDYFLN